MNTLTKKMLVLSTSAILTFSLGISYPTAGEGAQAPSSGAASYDNSSQVLSSMRFRPAGYSKFRDRGYHAENEAGKMANAQEDSSLDSTTFQNNGGGPVVNGTVNTSTPNPRVSYSSYTALCNAVGYHPLFLLKNSGYVVQDFSAISGQVADIRYHSRTDRAGVNPAFVTIRTGRGIANLTAEQFSGLYGYQWSQETMGNTTVELVEISPSSFGAYWQSGGYQFSVYAENMNRWDFMGLVSDGLVDLTEHYYAF